MAAGAAARTLQLTAFRDCMPGGRIVAAFVWAIADQDTVAANQWGMFSGVPGGALTARATCAPRSRRGRVGGSRPGRSCTEPEIWQLPPLA